MLGADGPGAFAPQFCSLALLLITVPPSRCPTRQRGRIPAGSVHPTKSIPLNAVGDFAAVLAVAGSRQQPVFLASNPGAAPRAPVRRGGLASSRRMQEAAGGCPESCQPCLCLPASRRGAGACGEAASSGKYHVQLTPAAWSLLILFCARYRNPELYLNYKSNNTTLGLAKLFAALALCSNVAVAYI